jgi:hypothetical protein
MAAIGNRILSGMGQRLRRKFPHRLFFLHLPKCGGTSIVEALGACFGPRALDPTQFYLDAPAVFQTANAFDQHYREISERLLLYAMAHPKYRFITGHFFFSEKAQRDFGERWQTITVLRDPISRWFSQYFFNRYKAGDHYKTDAELEAYIESEEGIGAGRTLLNVLSGSGQDWIEDPQEGVQRAVANLKKMSLVGYLEDLDRFATDFRQRYGAGLNIGRLRKNPAASAEQSAQVSPAIVERVKHICRYDNEIYRLAADNGGSRKTAARG